MRLFEYSTIANERQKIFAWYPVPIRTMVLHPRLGVKVCKTRWVIFQYVYRTIKLRSGVYFGAEFSLLESPTPILPEDTEVGANNGQRKENEEQTKTTSSALTEGICEPADTVD